MEATYPYALKNHRIGRKIPLVKGILRHINPLVEDSESDELVLYGIRLLAKQLLGTVLDIEVDHTGVRPRTGNITGSTAGLFRRAELRGIRQTRALRRSSTLA